MAEWEDELRAVVEHRGRALLGHADALLTPTEPTMPPTAEPDGTGVDPALELTVDALVRAFRRRGRRAGGEHGTVRLVTDDDLDSLAAAVRREQDGLAHAPRGTSTVPDAPAPSPDDGPSDALSARLPELVARVRVVRRRARRQALVGVAAAVVVAALATTAAVGRPWDRATPDPAPTATPYAGACGAALPTGASLLPVTLDAVEPPDRTVVADQTWRASYAGDASALTDDDRATLGTMRPEVVLTQGGRVVGLGVNTGEALTMAPDGTSSTDEIRWPGLASPGPGSVPGDLGRFSDHGVGDGETSVAVRFVPCGGGSMPAGSYRAYLYGTDGAEAHVLPEAAAVTVLADAPTGYQPPWLAGSALACGESVDEFLTRIMGRTFTRLELGDATFHDDEMSYTFTNTSGSGQHLVLPRRAAIAWVQRGRIVGVGGDERGTDPTPVAAGKTVHLSTRPWDTTDRCAQPDGARSRRLAPGSYRVFAYARVPATQPDQPDDWFIEWSGPTSVVVAADGSVSFG